MEEQWDTFERLLDWAKENPILAIIALGMILSFLVTILK